MRFQESFGVKISNVKTLNVWKVCLLSFEKKKFFGVKIIILFCENFLSFYYSFKLIFFFCLEYALYMVNCSLDEDINKDRATMKEILIWMNFLIFI